MNAGNPRSSNPSNSNPYRTTSGNSPQTSRARSPQRASEPNEPAYDAPQEEQRTAPAKPSRAPTHVAYHVRELQGRKEKKAIWTRIGSAWPHHDGNGFNIQVEVVPLDGKITLRVAEDRRDK